MASWIVHLRIADILVKKLNVDYNQFIIGNLAPDSGNPNEKGEYVPPSKLTHWTPTNDNHNIQYEKFFNVI